MHDRDEMAVFSGMLPTPPLRYSVLLLLVAACSNQSGGGAPRIERIARGDTAVVRTTGDGEWGPIRDAVEQLRGTKDGAATALGEVNSAIALPSGGALLFDAKAPNGPTLELFDSNGRYVTAIGRQGGGPGEFRAERLVSLAANPDGTILVLDAPNHRIDRYAPDGRAKRSIPIGDAAANGGPEFLRAGAGGSAYVWSYVVRDRGLQPAAMTGYFHYDSTGKVLDTIPPQQLWFPPPPRPKYAAADQWSALNDGRVIMSRTDLVGFLIKTVHGDTPPYFVELSVPTAVIGPDERKEIQTMTDFWDGQVLAHDKVAVQHEPVPNHKPAIRELMLDGDGRVWVQRNVESVPVPPHPAPGASHLAQTFDQPTVWSAFRTDGRYLGDVRFPIGVRVIGVVRDVAWALLFDTSNQQRLVKYRILGVSGK